MKFTCLKTIVLLLVFVFFSSCSNHNDNEIKGITSNTSSINEMAEERSNILTTTESAMATQTNSTYLTTDTDSISAISGTNTTEAKSIHMILQERISALKCADSLERFSDNINVSQEGMNIDEIIKLLSDQNIVCYYSFNSDVLMHDYQNYNDNGYGKIEHYLFSSYSELERFVYSTYEMKYAENLLTNLYGEQGILFSGDDKYILYNPSVQGINVLIGEVFPLYECKITEVTDSRIYFNVISCETDTVLWKNSAILQGDEWRLETMFPNIQER